MSLGTETSEASVMNLGDLVSVSPSYIFSSQAKPLREYCVFNYLGH